MKRCCDCKFYYRGWKWLWEPRCLHKESTDKITGNSPKSCDTMRNYSFNCGDGRYYEERKEMMTVVKEL
jgi:hypothetical protein